VRFVVLWLVLGRLVIRLVFRTFLLLAFLLLSLFQFLLLLLVSLLVITLGAFRFTKHEEERTKALLADPSEYDRYRERVPALFPSFRRRAGRAAEPSAPGAG